LDVSIDNTITGYTLKFEGNISFNAYPRVPEVYTQLASLNGWPECHLGDSSMHDGRVVTQCWITIPHTAMENFERICETLDGLCEHSKHGWPAVEDLVVVIALDRLGYGG